MICAARGRLLNELSSELFAIIFELAGCEEDEDVHFAVSPFIDATPRLYHDYIYSTRAPMAKRKRSNVNSVTISHVCRGWRTAALTLPRLWSTILITSTTPVSKVQALIDRSSPRPIMVYLTAKAHTNLSFHPIVQRLGTVSHRWMSLRVDSNSEAPPLTAEIATFELPNLESLCVDGRPWIPSTRLPRLKRLTALNPDWVSNGNLIQSRFARSLENVAGRLSLEDMRIISSQSACLTNLTLLPTPVLLSSWTYGQSQASIITNPIVFPHLETLTLRRGPRSGDDWNDLAPLFRGLILPTLKHLVVWVQPLRFSTRYDLKFPSLVSFTLIAMPAHQVSPAMDTNWPVVSQPSVPSDATGYHVPSNMNSKHISTTELVGLLETMPHIKSLTFEGCDATLFHDLRQLTDCLGNARHPLGSLVELNLLDCKLSPHSGQNLFGPPDGISPPFSAPSYAVPTATYEPTAHFDLRPFILQGYGTNTTTQAYARTSTSTQEYHHPQHQDAQREILGRFLEMWSKPPSADSQSAEHSSHSDSRSPQRLRLSIRQCGVSTEFKTWLESWWKGGLEIDMLPHKRNPSNYD